MKGIFRLIVRNDDGSIFCDKTVPNTITGSGVAQIGDDGFTTPGVHYNSVSSSQGCYQNYEICLGDRTSVPETASTPYFWGHFSAYNPQVTITATASAYKIKWTHLDTEQFAVERIPGCYGCIGLRSPSYKLLMGKNIPGTMIGAVARSTAPPGGGYGNVSPSGTYQPPTGSDGVTISHLYPHMDYAIQTRNGPNDVGTATYVWWRRPHLWDTTGSWGSNEAYQDGWNWNLSADQTGADMLIDDMRESNPVNLSEIAASLCSDPSDSPYYASGRIFITYEGDSTADGRAAYLDTGTWTWVDITHDSADSGSKFRNGVIDGNGDLWVASDLHAYKWDASEDSWSKKTLPASGTQKCYQVARDPATDDIYFMSNDLDYLYRFQTADSEPSNSYYMNLDTTYFGGGKSQYSVYSKQMWVDSSGAYLWLGVDTTSTPGGGVFKIGLDDPPDNVTYFNSASGLASDRVTDIAIDSNDNVWVIHSIETLDAATGIECINAHTNEVTAYGSNDGFVTNGRYYTLGTSSVYSFVSFIEEDDTTGGITTYYVNRDSGMTAGVYIQEDDVGSSFIRSEDARGSAIFVGQFLYWLVRSSTCSNINLRRHPVKAYYGWNGAAWGLWNTDSSGSGDQYGPRVTASGHHEIDQGIWCAFSTSTTNPDDDQFTTGTDFVMFCADGISKNESQTLDLTYSFYTANAHFNETENGTIPADPPHEVTLDAAASGNFLAVDGEDSADITVSVSGVAATLVASSGDVSSAGEFWVDNERGVVVFSSDDAGQDWDATFTWLSRD